MQYSVAKVKVCLKKSDRCPEFYCADTKEHFLTQFLKN